MSVHLHFFINSPQAVFDLENGFFSWLIAHYVQYWPGVAIFVLYHGLVLSQAFRLNQVLNNLKMFPTNNFPNLIGRLPTQRKQLEHHSLFYIVQFLFY
jgi:hypothetical protein